MHLYSVDLSERKYVPKTFMVLSILTTYFLHSLLEGQPVISALFPPYFISIPSAFGFYSLYMLLFEKHLWKHNLVRKSFFLKTPDLNGKWSGHLKTSYDDHSKEYPCSLEISQTWTHITICLKTDNSFSNSFAASINLFSSNNNLLVYEYRNEPKSGAPSDLHSHLGTARLFLSEINSNLEGDYYAGKDRLRYGHLYLKKINSRKNKKWWKVF